jgi:hypothetical protein
MRWPLAVWHDEPCRMRTAKPCGPDVSTLASTGDDASHHAGMVTRKPDHQGEPGISRNPSRREGRIASGVPVVTNSCPFSFGHEAAGASGIRLSLRPLSSRGTISGKARAKQAAGTQTYGFNRLVRAEGGDDEPHQQGREFPHSFFQEPVNWFALLGSLRDVRSAHFLVRKFGRCRPFAGRQSASLHQAEDGRNHDQGQKR